MALPTADPGAPEGRGSRQPARSASTRASLLEAAREVFGVAGFAEAAIADVVARAGASVGSLYHHFGGKADLYLALYEHYAERQEERSALAVRRALADGTTDRVALFTAGARAYLEGCWVERDLARLFLAGGGPPGFELVMRRRYRDWTRRNAVLLGAEGSEPFAEALVLVLTTVSQQAGWEVAMCDSEEHAYRLAGQVIGLIARIGTEPV